MNLLWQQKLCNLQQLKKSKFSRTAAHIFVSWRRLCDYHAICCMDGKTIQCLPNPWQHVPIFNNFRVIRCLSQCISPKIAIFTTFLFPELPTRRQWSLQSDCREPANKDSLAGHSWYCLTRVWLHRHIPCHSLEGSSEQKFLPSTDVPRSFHDR